MDPAWWDPNSLGLLKFRLRLVPLGLLIGLDIDLVRQTLAEADYVRGGRQLQCRCGLLQGDDSLIATPP